VEFFTISARRNNVGRTTVYATGNITGKVTLLGEADCYGTVRAKYDVLRKGAVRKAIETVEKKERLAWTRLDVEQRQAILNVEAMIAA
jgi:hypothetical protein